MATPQKMPRYHGSSGTFGTAGPEPDPHGPQATPPHLVLRVASVLPFAMTAIIGFIAIIAYIVVVVFGAGPGSQPIWRWAQGKSAGEIVSQVLVAVAIGLIPVAVAALAGAATWYGYREDASRIFWIAVEALWGVLVVALVVLARSHAGVLRSLSFSALDWWFAFGVLAYAMIVAGMRVRIGRAARD